MVVGMRPAGSAQQLEARRCKAVLLLKQGCSYQTVAQKVQSSISSLVRWMQAFRRKGKAGLKPRPTPGRPPQLQRHQKRELVDLLKRGARAAGYPTEMWTTPRVAEQIRRRWKIAYHPGHVWKILIGLGWSCQKPERRATQRNPRKIARWKRQDWPRIKKSPAVGRASGVH